MHSGSEIKLRDIAQAAGISIMAVSMALRNHPRISEKRRKEIRLLADQMGYRPNIMAAALSSHRRQVAKRPSFAELAWLNYWSKSDSVQNHDMLRAYRRGAIETAKNNGYGLEEIILNDQHSRLRDILHNRKITGILIPSRFVEKNSHILQELNWDCFCAVRLGYSSAHPKTHMAAPNLFCNSMMAFQNIWEKGYRRIGFITDQTTPIHCRAGFLAAQSEVDSESHVPALVISHEIGEKSVATQVYDWMKRHQPDAIVTNLEDVPHLFHEIGCRVPEEVGLASLNVGHGHALSGIFQNHEEIGRAAVELLLMLIRGKRFGIPETAQEILVSGKWVDGKTLPDKRKA